MSEAGGLDAAKRDDDDRGYEAGDPVFVRFMDLGFDLRGVVLPDAPGSSTWIQRSPWSAPGRLCLLVRVERPDRGPGVSEDRVVAIGIVRHVADAYRVSWRLQVV